MTRRGGTVAALVALCTIAGAIAVTVALRRRDSAGVPGQLVPPSWAEFRTSVGHQAHVGKGNAECKDCHDFERDGFKNPGVSPCVRCHEKESAHAHAGNAQNKTDCLTCHVFAPTRTAPQCISCHRQPQGQLGAVIAHASTACAPCHRMHQEPSIVAKDCASCHDERALAHAEHTDSKGCFDCHEAHAPARNALSVCSTCHARPAGPKPAGHDSCIGCHKPHDFVAGGARACIGCHGVKPTLGAEQIAVQVAAHASCTSCHTPHAPAQAADSCRGCHASIAPVHGTKTACVACHEPHLGDGTAIVDACTSCHRTVAMSDTSAHAGGVACVGCHKPHHFESPDRQGICATCHAREAKLAASSKGHSDCASCHGGSAHTPVAAPACATCHAKEQASAPTGHQKCLACHDAHSAARLPQAACSSCHANKTEGPHKTVKGGCDTCHRPHGPNGLAAPPACLTCHSRDALPALHAVGGHTKCAECHTSHAPPNADRATCTGTCHTDRRNHQPQAQLCNGCHVFRK